MAESNQATKPSFFEIWWTAARPHTLTASLSPCLVAYASVRPPANLQAAWTLFCISVQIGTNLHNDYADFIHGADNDKRVGQARATARGWLTPTQTCTAATLTLTITFFCGVYLAWASQQLDNVIIWVLILSSIFNAFAYTAGPYPLGYIGMDKCSIAYAGLGDIFVLLYFGFVAVWMLPYIMWLEDPQKVDVTSLVIYGWQVGLLATNIIVVNNLRDRHTDVSAGKRTTAVRFGKTFSIVEYAVCLFGAYSLVLVSCWWHRSGLLLLPLLSLPLAIKEFAAIRVKEGGALNPHVGGAAKVQFLFCVLLAVGLLVVG